MTNKEPAGDGRQLTFDFAKSPGEASERELRRQLREIGITAPEVAVLVYIWKFAKPEDRVDNRSSVRASMELIAARMKCSPSTVHKGVKRLKQCGLILAIEDEEPHAYEADWGVVRAFSITVTGGDLQRKFAQLRSQREESPPEDVRGSFAEHSHSHSHSHSRSVRGDIRTAAPSGSSFEAFSFAESEKEEEQTNKQNFVSSFVNSSLPEIFGALDSRAVEELPTHLFEISTGSVVSMLRKYLAAVLRGTGEFDAAAMIELVGSILRARELIHVHKRDMPNPQRYVLKCLKRGLTKKYWDLARAEIDAEYARHATP